MTDPQQPTVPALNATAADAARAALAATAGGSGVAVVILVGDVPDTGRRLLAFRDGPVQGTLGNAHLDELGRSLAGRAFESGGVLTEAVQLSGHEVLLYVEVHRPPEQLVVVGAGHIAVPLARLAHDVGFLVTVLDDREEFATEERFPEGVQVRRADFVLDPFAGLSINDRTYVALVTRGHRWDFDCLRRLLEGPLQPHYIGMIGSRRRVRAAFLALLEAGVPRDRLADIHAPIGLELGAETPAEIAVSIVAELIAMRRGRAGDTLARQERVLERLLPEVD